MRYYLYRTYEKTAADRVPTEFLHRRVPWPPLSSKDHTGRDKCGLLA